MLTIDIVIPVYNKELYISELLNLLLTRTNLYDKIILVDDCSTDNSTTIIKTFKEKFPLKIYFYQQEVNKGPHHARMKGAELSNKNFIMFIDADDLINLNGLDIFLSSNINWINYGICFGETEKVYNRISQIKDTHPQSKQIFKIIKYPLSLTKYSPTMSGILIRKDIVPQMNIGNCEWGEDIIFYIKALKRSSFFYRSIPIGIYCIMEGTRGTSGGSFNKRLKFLKILRSELQPKTLNELLFYVTIYVKTILAWFVKKIK